MMKFDLHKTLHSASGPMQLSLQGEVNTGGFIGIYGPSGAGKSSLFRMLTGLMKPDQGRIEVDGQCWYDETGKTFLPVQQRNAGLVFQEYALFPNMTVSGNLNYGLSGSAPSGLITTVMDTLELNGLADLKPGALSGGQQQRVALGRALVNQPKLLLLDEPLSALDPAIRKKLQDYILEAHRNFGLTTMMISHDESELSKMADEIWNIEAGKFTKKASPDEFFGNGMGSSSQLLSGTIVQIEQRDDSLLMTVEIGGKKVIVHADAKIGSKLKVGDIIDVEAGNLAFGQ